MISDTKKLLSVGLLTALVGGSVGALVTRSTKTADPVSPTSTIAATATPSPLQLTANTPGAATTDQQALAANTDGARFLTPGTTDGEVAYRDGFSEGFRAARDGSRVDNSSERISRPSRRSVEPTRVVYRNARATRSRRVSDSRRVYYDYEQPRKRSFWSKHRDKLTVAAGTGGGALIGGLLGGKKGAIIGGAAGAGSSALYTYKIRKRNRRY